MIARFFQSIVSTIILVLLSLSVVISGCGGGGGGGNGSSGPTYSGSTEYATISESNAQELGATATEAAHQSVNADSANDANPFGVTITPSRELSQLVRRVTTQVLGNTSALSMPIGATYTSDQLGEQFCGGSVTIPDDFIESETLNGTITYRNLCYDDGVSGQIILNGTVSFSETDTTTVIRYSNFSITADGETHTLNATYTCETGLSLSCSFSTDYVGESGETYRIADFSVSGNSVSGYTVSATFFHPDYGSMAIQTTSPVTFNCSDGGPDSGTITFTGSGGTSGSINFDSCEAYTYCYDEGSGEVCNSATW